MADILGRIQKLKRLKAAANPEELARVKARTGYSDQLLWLLALNGSLLMGFRGDAFVLCALSAGDKEDYRQSLIEWWGISNRQELIRMLDDISQGMHSHEYDAFLEIWHGPAEGVKAFMKEPGEEREKLPLVGGTMDIVGSRSLLAWDFGRGVMLSLLGCKLGYLSAEEALSHAQKFANEIGKRYRSWEDYGLNFLIGRVFWAEDKESYMAGTEEAFRWLLSREGPWSVAPWPNAGRTGTTS
jgi:hypothetical protein